MESLNYTILCYEPKFNQTNFSPLLNESCQCLPLAVEVHLPTLPIHLYFLTGSGTTAIGVQRALCSCENGLSTHTKSIPINDPYLIRCISRQMVLGDRKVKRKNLRN